MSVPENWNTNSDAHEAMLTQHLANKFAGHPPKEGIVHDIHHVAHQLTGSLGDVAPAGPGQNPETIHAMRAFGDIPETFYLPPEWKLEDSLKLATTGYLLSQVGKDYNLDQYDLLKIFTASYYQHHHEGMQAVSDEFAKHKLPDNDGRFAKVGDDELLRGDRLLREAKERELGLGGGERSL